MHRNTADPHTAQKAAGFQVRLALLRLRLAVKAGFREDQPRDDRGRWSGGGGSGTVQVTRIDRTGDAKIDRTTDHLVEIAAEVVETAGPGKGPVYGIAVHTAFARAVRVANLPGVGRNGVEQSFSLGDIGRYGLSGSVRTDVIKRTDESVLSPIVAVWDLKTGSAGLDPKRIKKIRENLNIDENVPIIQMHIILGISIKSVYASIPFKNRHNNLLIYDTRNPKMPPWPLY